MNLMQYIFVTFYKSLLYDKNIFLQDNILICGNHTKKIFSFDNSQYNNGSPKSLPAHTDKNLYYNNLLEMAEKISDNVLI